MAARFLVVGSFHVRSRNLFVLVGDFVEGSGAPGAMVLVRLGGLEVSTRVASFEVIDVTYAARRYHGLALAYEEPEELEFWSELELSNEEVELE